MPTSKFKSIRIEEPFDAEKKAVFILHSHRIEKINYTYDETLEILTTGKLSHEPKEEDTANLETVTISEELIGFQPISPIAMAETIVKNHARALDYALSREFREAGLQTAARKIHRTLFRGDRSWNHSVPPGKYRDSGTTVGSEGYKRSCPHPAFVPYLMKRWEKRGDEIPKTDEGLLRLHCEFELIHPFPDGNGRTGRLLWAGLSKKYGLPISIVDSSKGSRIEYYKSIMASHDREYAQEYYLNKKDSLDKKTLEIIAKSFVLGSK